MRLEVTADPTTGIWAQLLGQSTEEWTVLAVSAGRGAWTLGRVPESIVRFHALAARLGYPVEPGRR